MNILSLSYGKDSLACLEACKQLGWKIDGIVHAEVWATDDIPADLPPMVEFKKKADRIIKERYGLEVEHRCATRKVGGGTERLTYSGYFYHTRTRGDNTDKIKGFPCQRNSWCKQLKFGYGLQANLRKRVLQNLPSWEKSGGCKDSRYPSEEETGVSNLKPIYGFPIVRGEWCNSNLKLTALNFPKITERM